MKQENIRIKWSLRWGNIYPIPNRFPFCEIQNKLAVFNSDIFQTNESKIVWLTCQNQGHIAFVWFVHGVYVIQRFSTWSKPMSLLCHSRNHTETFATKSLEGSIKEWNVTRVATCFPFYATGEQNSFQQRVYPFTDCIIYQLFKVLAEPLQLKYWANRQKQIILHWQHFWAVTFIPN